MALLPADVRPWWIDSMRCQGPPTFHRGRERPCPARVETLMRCYLCSAAVCQALNCSDLDLAIVVMVVMVVLSYATMVAIIMVAISISSNPLVGRIVHHAIVAPVSAQALTTASPLATRRAGGSGNGLAQRTFAARTPMLATSGCTTYRRSPGESRLRHELTGLGGS